ncbi:MULTISPECIES: MauE/DoxX family redox-associated membrane protein [unclassified Pseudoalteromonas]|uniref:MauE/DoxX family redox-associated membrane protein n=2 Tax=Pseudoalteromonas TaxID=53246 RepID=UPI0038571A27
MSLLSTFGAMLLAFTFLFAGIKKSIIFKEFQSTLELSFKVPRAFSKFAAFTIITCELSILPTLLFPTKPLIIYQLISFIMLIFVFIPLYTLMTGKVIQCNCFGQSSVLDWQDLLRNTILFLASLLLCIAPPLQTFNLQILTLFFLALTLVNLMINLKSISTFLHSE